MQLFNAAKSKKLRAEERKWLAYTILHDCYRTSLMLNQIPILFQISVFFVIGHFFQLHPKVTLIILMDRFGLVDYLPVRIIALIKHVNIIID